MEHGGNIRQAETRFGHAAGSMLDLSTGICPRSWPVPADLLNAADWRDLPQEEDEIALAEALRSSITVPDDAAILAAPGSQILISLMPLLGKAGPVHLPDPVYGEHAAAWQQHGFETRPHPAASLPVMAGGSLVVVQPGNPMGERHDPAAILAAAEVAAETGGLVVVDEAFADLDPAASVLPWASRPGLIVLRSFGKFYGLAGLRLGLAIGAAGDIARLRQLIGPWAVSTLALKIGTLALADHAFQHDQRDWIRDHHALLAAILDRHGLEAIGGTGLYTLIADDDASGLHRYLAEAGIWVRAFAREPRWLRFGLADRAGLERLDAALGCWRRRTNNVASD